MNLLLLKIRQNIFFRILMKCFALLVMKLEKMRYKKSEDALFIKNLHDKYIGKRCFIVGNGPSLLVEDLEKIRGEISFASNRIYDILPYTEWVPTFYMCSDAALVDEIMLKRPNMEGLKDAVLLCRNKKFVDSMRDKFNIHEIILCGKYPIRRNRLVIDSISEDVSEYFTVSQSITCNMFELAFYMGIKEIYLIGIDHNFTVEVDMDGKSKIDETVKHHFEQQIDKAVYPTPKEALTKCYEVIKKYAEIKGINIYNATRGGKLEVFKRVDFNSLF